MRVQWTPNSSFGFVIQGRYLARQSDLHIGFIYLAPEGSPHSSVDCFVDMCEAVGSRCTCGEVILCGDTNARKGDSFHYVPSNQMVDNDINDVLPNEQWYVNIDKVMNNYGRHLIELGKCTGLQICNGRTFRSCFTCCKYNAESVNYVPSSHYSSSYVNAIHVDDKTADSDFWLLTSINVSTYCNRAAITIEVTFSWLCN